MRISLNGTWSFYENTTPEKVYQGQVPGCVQTDYIDAGVLPDPFYGNNEVLFYPLAEQDFTYTKIFTYEGEGPCKLVFEGIDTFADIYLNGHFVGKTQNMFVRYAFEVGNILHKGENILKVILRSPNVQGRKYQKTYASAYRYNMKSWVRKAQYSFGWDWGPTLLQTGIWKSVYWEQGRDMAIIDPYVQQMEVSSQRAVLRCSARIENPVGDLKANVSIEGKDYPAQVLTDEQGTYMQCDIILHNPRLWWPAGYGQPNLYEVTFQAGTASKAVKTGLRSIHIIQKKDEWGQSFVFEINGIKIFCKGVNWIPVHSFTSRMQEKDYRELLQLCQEANCNMVRVWGGGIYENDIFYELCDHLGLMVWQDFMFACEVYPDEFEFFRDNFKVEAIQNIKRLRNHACLTLWCGNNECNWGMRDWWNLGDPQYGGNYLYKIMLPELIRALDSDTPYHVSSPFGGSHPNSPDGGDKHTWNVWSAWHDFRKYQLDKGRFISEFGFQSMACMPTWEKYLPKEDQTPLSAAMRNRNKQVDGTQRLFRYLTAHVGLPKDFKSYVYLTQYVQKEAIAFAVSHYRRNMAYIAGALYWQINDCWPVASWSSVDFMKNKKALYYETKRIFDKILPIFWEEDGVLSLTLASDEIKDQEGILTVEAFDTQGSKCYAHRRKVAAMAQKAQEVWRENLSDMCVKTGETAVLPVDGGNTVRMRQVDAGRLQMMVFAEFKTEDKTFTAHYLPETLLDMRLPVARIKAKEENGVIYLKSATPVPCCVIEATDNVSDNFFPMKPKTTYAVKLDGAQFMKAQDIRCYRMQ